MSASTEREFPLETILILATGKRFPSRPGHDKLFNPGRISEFDRVRDIIEYVTGNKYLNMEGVHAWSARAAVAIFEQHPTLAKSVPEPSQDVVAVFKREDEWAENLDNFFKSTPPEFGEAHAKWAEQLDKWLDGQIATFGETLKIKPAANASIELTPEEQVAYPEIVEMYASTRKGRLDSRQAASPIATVGTLNL